MPDKKKKNAFGWWQKFSSGNPEKNAEIFNHNMGASSESSEASGEVAGTAMAEAIDNIVNSPETTLEAMRALREVDTDFSNGLSYKDGSFYRGDMEVVSDNPDELPDEPVENNADQPTSQPVNTNTSTKKKFRVTAKGLGQIVIEAETKNIAMAKYRERYGNAYKVSGVHEC